MTYREAFDAMVRIAGDSDVVCLSVDTWRYSTGEEALTWKIWSAVRNDHYDGKTPEVALAAFAAANSAPRTDADAVDAVGEVSL